IGFMRKELCLPKSRALFTALPERDLLWFHLYLCSDSRHSRPSSFTSPSQNTWINKCLCHSHPIHQPQHAKGTPEQVSLTLLCASIALNTPMLCTIPPLSI